MKLDATKEVDTTGWEPGAADEGARLENAFAVMKMVDYHVYHLCSYTSGVGGSAISLVFRKAVLDEIQVAHRGVYSHWRGRFRKCPGQKRKVPNFGG